jgi:hypothetical protein
MQKDKPTGEQYVAARKDEPRKFNPSQARQGEIILRSPLAITIFVVGLAGLVALAVYLRLGG